MNPRQQGDPTPATPSGERRYSLPEVARRICLHRATINEMVLSGRISAERDGATWSVTETELRRLVATYRRPPNTPVPATVREPRKAVRIPASLHGRLTLAALTHGLSLSDAATAAIAQWLDE